MDDLDLLTEKTAQLSSMLMMISGSGYESFITYNETIKNNYLWACASLAAEVDKISVGLALNHNK